MGEWLDFCADEEGGILVRQRYALGLKGEILRIQAVPSLLKVGQQVSVIFRKNGELVGKKSGQRDRQAFPQTTAFRF